MPIGLRIFRCLLAAGVLLATAVACSGEESADEISPVEARDTENDQDGANEPDTNDADGSTTTTTTTTVVEIAPGVTVAPGIEVPPTSPTTIPSPPPDDPQAAELFEAYRAQLDAVLAALQTQDPDHPSLADTSTGQQLASLRAAIRDRAAERTVTLVPSPTRSQLRYVGHQMNGSGPSLLSVCLWDDTFVFNLATGEVSNDTLDKTLRLVTLTKSGGRWKTLSVDSATGGQQCS